VTDRSDVRSEVDPQSWDAGYGNGYSAGYSFAVGEVISWLLDNGHPEAGEALRYLFSPEGIAEANAHLRELYGSLAKLAEEARSDLSAEEDR